MTVCMVGRQTERLQGYLLWPRMASLKKIRQKQTMAAMLNGNEFSPLLAF